MIRAGRLTSGIAALSLAAPLPALDPTAAPSNRAANNVALRFSPEAREDHVGKAAGLACLPNGKIYLRDFAPSPLLARDQLADALDRMGAAPLATVAVTLLSLEGKLCARDFGMFGRGDRQSLSGAVTFRFAWSLESGSVHQEAVTVEALRHNGGTPGDLFTRALDELAHRIAARR
ncbi:MAG TPA: hypothetical protein VFP14_03990 [Novosphingobium sp.]|nr:hypothetical protein [Novosphingobium sp.]